MGSAPVLAWLDGQRAALAYVVARQVVLDGPKHTYGFRDVALVAWHPAERGRWHHGALVPVRIACPDGAQIECVAQVDADAMDVAGDGRDGSVEGAAETSRWRILKAVIIEPVSADALLEHLWPEWVAQMPELFRSSKLLTTGRPLLFAVVDGRKTAR